MHGIVIGEPWQNMGYNSQREWGKSGWHCHVWLVYCSGGNIVCLVRLLF
jgi:hypothetical protein